MLTLLLKEIRQKPLLWLRIYGVAPRLPRFRGERTRPRARAQLGLMEARRTCD